jgi:hypothetical protein
LLLLLSIRRLHRIKCHLLTEESAGVTPELNKDVTYVPAKLILVIYRLLTRIIWDFKGMFEIRQIFKGA